MTGRFTPMKKVKVPRGVLVRDERRLAMRERINANNPSIAIGMIWLYAKSGHVAPQEPRDARPRR